jgi:site-specific recombinase XerD
MKHVRLHITDTNPLNLCAMVELWLNDLEAGNASTNTITVYRFILNTFLRQVGNIPVTDITPQHIRLYLIARRRQGKSPQTVAGNFRTIHTFFRWLCRQGILGANPCDLVESPKGEKVIQWLRKAEEFIGKPTGVKVGARHMRRTFAT